MTKISTPVIIQIEINKSDNKKGDKKMFYLTYDLGMYDDETICEEFETVEELLERYEEIKWEVCEIEAWKDEKKIAPWYK